MNAMITCPAISFVFYVPRSNPWSKRTNYDWENKCCRVCRHCASRTH